jgi:hypothetical protein
MTARKKRTDKAALARKAVRYLAQTDLKLKWEFSEDDPPPPEVADLIAGYFSDGEIEATTGSLLCDYLITRLKQDYLPQDEPSRSAPNRIPKSYPAVCRVVCGDE